jgi:hypothetical protein
MSEAKFDLGRLFGAYVAEIEAALAATRGILWHPGQKGAAVEARFRELLRKVLPARFGVSEGVIYDHLGARSGQCDIVIFDKDQAPIVFNENGTRAIPNETVFAVIEIKTQLRKADVQNGFAAAERLRSMSKAAVETDVIKESFVLVEPPLSYWPALYYIFAVESDGDGTVEQTLKDELADGCAWQRMPNMIWVLSKHAYCYYGNKSPQVTEKGIISFVTPDCRLYKVDTRTNGDCAFALFFDMVLNARVYGRLNFLRYFGSKVYAGAVI